MLIHLVYRYTLEIITECVMLELYCVYNRMLYMYLYTSMCFLNASFVVVCCCQDESEIDKQDKFEETYNFRFEEPGGSKVIKCIHD